MLQQVAGLARGHCFECCRITPPIINILKTLPKVSHLFYNCGQLMRKTANLPISQVQVVIEAALKRSVTDLSEKTPGAFSAPVVVQLEMKKTRTKRSKQPESNKLVRPQMAQVSERQDGRNVIVAANPFELLRDDL